MNNTPHPKKFVSRIPRVLAVGAAVGIVCASGMATATSAVAATPTTSKAAPVYGGDGGEHFQCGNGLLALLNFCN
ncbi:hypothetical protein ACFZBP_37325 [Streptomyces sp. NPDC008086]|uniref:hypothetical protein n=1 Tax=unclassified Streptomyces TaxID=2593676 RepID=UPI00367A0776